MAPSRKKGGGKAAAAASARRQWKVGDLVLAKVKGFSAWPAAVSEPEKWGQPADSKKVFVLFFGTQQIAFCNPADVESFTEEKKQSFLTKRHSKGSVFVRAVKEIVESYDKQKKHDQTNDSNTAEETTVGSLNTTELPQVRENLSTQLESNSSHGRDESALLSEDASAAEQMLALRHNNLDRNGACDNAAAKDLCELATNSSRRRTERVRSQKCAPQKLTLPVQHSKTSSRLDLDRLQRSMLQCSDGDQGVNDIGEGAIRRRNRIQRSSHSVADDVVSSALNLHGSDEENASEIATVESDNNSTNEGNGVDCGSKVEHSDAVDTGCVGGHKLNEGLDFQIRTTVNKKKRKPAKKRETSDHIYPPAKVETEGLGTKACDSCQGSQNSHECSNERPSEENGDEHLPLVKRARVRMSRTSYADEMVNVSSQFDERSFKETLVSAAKQTSYSVNREDDIVFGHDTSAVKELGSSVLSAKLPVDMVDVVPSQMEKPFDRLSPSRVCDHTVGDKQTDMEFHENAFSMTPDDEAARAQSNQLSGLPEGKCRVSEVVQVCSEESQTMNCLNSGCDPIDMQWSRQSEMKETSLNPDTVDSFANMPPSLCSGLDTKASCVPAQSPCQHQSQENDSCDHSLVVVGGSSLMNIDNMTQVVQSHDVEHSPLFCSVVGIQEAENMMQENGSTVLKEKQGSPVKELHSDKQAHIKHNPVLSATECDIIVKEAEPKYETVYSHCEGAVQNKELVNSSEADEQKEQINATNSVSVSENLSHEKMSISPDSSARGTLHSNSVCHISAAENANIMHNSNCSINVPKKITSDDIVKQERKVETNQVKKFGSSDLQLTIESFETALGSLVRTKDTIGRATLLAMDLMKFGVSAKAMEIIAHTLESETNLQRRVDLFFLVDSIAQCSKGLNGDAGGVYLSSIQAMLPRLLAAAVPVGATTQENRTQCLKVLRHWLERRILPESVVRQHIRELDSHSNVPACLYSRRSARTERALDDPVRDMEGMVLDEYGSNSTLQLHGFCMPAMLKDEDEGSDSDGGDFESVTPEHESRIPEEHVTPTVTERHTCILEDVDGELEMEDVAPPWEIGSSAAITDQAVNTKSADCRPVSGTPPAQPSQNTTQCDMSNSYSNGYPSMHGDHKGGPPPRMNPPMHYQSPESSYGSRGMPHGDGYNIQHRHNPSPHPPPPSIHQHAYMEPDHHVKGQVEGPSYPHRSHYEERNYHDSHERMRPAGSENRENWRYHHNHHPPSSHGPRYQERHSRGPYQSNGNHHHHHHNNHRESGRYHNQRWSRSPRGYNSRHSSSHYRPYSEGPIPAGMRDPGTYHERH